MNTTIDKIKASKEKCKNNRDNWKRIACKMADQLDATIQRETELEFILMALLDALKAFPDIRNNGKVDAALKMAEAAVLDEKENVK